MATSRLGPHVTQHCSGKKRVLRALSCSPNWLSPLITTFLLGEEVRTARLHTGSNEPPSGGSADEAVPNKECKGFQTLKLSAQPTATDVAQPVVGSNWSMSLHRACTSICPCGLSARGHAGVPSRRTWLT